ncbi:MAG: SBBP repeat-containing protein, partial [Armatimonadota bacterium]|nr:SBBP repeat-containing protein [Armatimonadota bacterium]
MTKVDPLGTSLIYSTYLGGHYGDYAYGIAVDGAGNAYVTGETGSFGPVGPEDAFPTTPGAFQTQLDLGYFSSFVAFVTKLN